MRADRPDVGDGQDQQQLQPLRRLYMPDKVADGLWVADIALERCAAHQQMPAYQPSYCLRLLPGEAEPRPELERDAFAEHRMVAAPALSDVMQQNCEVKRAARYDRRRQRR